ncbi:MAG: hypothetical protein KJ574_00710, partial [Nanoarchaeota archaeon]|nr:hypothetical protein [Nanoarchaeota archaeon]
SIASFLGVIAGLLLSFIAPEELKPGKKHLWRFQNLIFILILIFFLAFNGVGFWGMILAGSLLIVMLSYVHRIDSDFELHRLLYILSAALLYLSYEIKEWFMLTAALIFVYGMPVASLYVLENKKLSRMRLFLGVLKNYGFFVVLALLMAFLA